MSFYSRVLGISMGSQDPNNPGLRARIINGQEYLGPDDAPQSITLQDGDIIDDTNCAQIVPTTLPLNYKGLTFTNCNLLNVRLDPAAGHKIDDCLWIEKSYCSWLHPEMVAAGLPQCDANCQHQSTTDPTRYHDIVTGRHIGCSPDMDTTQIPDDDQTPIQAGN